MNSNDFDTTKTFSRVVPSLTGNEGILKSLKNPKARTRHSLVTGQMAAHVTALLNNITLANTGVRFKVLEYSNVCQ